MESNVWKSLDHSEFSDPWQISLKFWDKGFVPFNGTKLQHCFDKGRSYLPEIGRAFWHKWFSNTNELVRRVRNIFVKKRYLSRYCLRISRHLSGPMLTSTAILSTRLCESTCRMLTLCPRKCHIFEALGKVCIVLDVSEKREIYTVKRLTKSSTL